MKTPNPRGWTAGGTSRVCENMLIGKGPAPSAEPALNIFTLFGLQPPPPKPKPMSVPIENRHEFSFFVDEVEGKIYLPTGSHKTRKDGTPGAEEKIPLLIRKVTVSVRFPDGREAFYFRATSWGESILDSRTNQHIPIVTAAAELRRLCGERAESGITVMRECYQPKERKKKPPTPCDAATIERFANWKKRQAERSVRR